MTALAVAMRLVHLASRLVPAWRRRDWEQEWNAELRHHAVEDAGSASSIITRSTGAVADAAVLRTRAMQLELLWGDVRFALRNAARRPAFTLLVVATLALGIGVNSAVFALLDGVLLRPLRYRDPSRLVFLWQTLPSQNVPELEATPLDYTVWSTARSFASVAIIFSDAYTLSDEVEPERVRGSRVSSTLMPLLGIGPQIGRPFTPDEDGNGAAPVVILGDGLWRRRYGADPQILGRAIRVNGAAHTVVGVMPATASLPAALGDRDDVWLPMRMASAERDNAISHNYSIIARLADGATPASAAAELASIAAQTAAEHPDTHKGLGTRIVAFDEQTVRGIRPTLLVVAGGVALLLLVACANASTLLIARAANRTHETALRAALGATRSRLLSLAVAESLVYAALGGLAGLALGAWTLQALLPLFASSLPPAATVTIDARVALFTAGLAAVLGVVFGALVAAHKPGRVVDGLKSSSRTATGGGSVAHTRSALVVAQVALAVVLLCAAGLMLHSVVKLSRISPGFETERLMTFKLALSGGSYAAAAQRTAFTDQLLSRLGAVPGVTHAALTSTIPFGGTRGANGVEIEGRPPKPGEPVIIDQRYVTTDYFQAMRIPLLEGRGFASTDDSQAERVVVINRTMAERYWPGDSPIDRRVRLTAGYNSGSWFRIVGVVDSVRHISLSRGPVPEMYSPYAQASVPTFTVVIRTAGEPGATVPAARDVLRSIDRALPMYDVLAMSDRVASSFAQTRGTMLLLAVTAALAAALAGIAIYGSIWYSVSQRIPEIGIRLALGASRASVFLTIFRRAILLTCLGAAIGAAMTIAAGPLLSGLLFETPTTDPATFATVIATLLVLTMAATIVPARRAMSVDPMTALREL